MENIKKLTIGQVIHELQLDEVAIKIKGNSGKIPDELEMRGYVRSSSGFHYDLDDYKLLKTLEGKEFSIRWVDEKDDADFYVIIKRDLYNLIKYGEMPVQNNNLPNKFSFVHKNDRDITYRAELKNDRYLVSWKEGREVDNTSYSIDSAKKAVLCGDWLILNNI